MNLNTRATPCAPCVVRRASSGEGGRQGTTSGGRTTPLRINPVDFRNVD